MTQLGRTGKDFQTKDLKDHILDIPDTYVGSTDLRMKKEWIFDFETQKMKQVEMDLPEAVKRITLEIISNAGDNSYFSRTEGVDPGKIEFSWDDEGYLSVRNGGLPVPVEPAHNSTKEELVLVPTNVFSIPLTSSNYDTAKDRIGCGRNGYGSKLTNSFSTHFVVQVGDTGRTVSVLDSEGKAKAVPISGQEYIGSWRNNMRVLEKEAVTPGFRFSESQQKWVAITTGAYTGPSYVSVSWLLDFPRMNIKRNHYSEEELGLFARYMMEFSLTCGVPVSINGVDYDFRSIRKFASLFYHEDLIKTAVSHFCVAKENPLDDSCAALSRFPAKYLSLKKDSAKEDYIEKNGFIPESQILLLDTPDEGQSFTYVNGLVTSEGGVHLERLQKVLFEPIAKMATEKHKGTNKLTIKDIKPHVTVFLVNRLRNTKYNSQSKTKLENPVPNITIPESVVKEMMSSEWDLSERLQGQLNVKSNNDLKLSDGKRLATVRIEGLEDAHDAGTAKSSSCDLLVSEGSSGALYAKFRIANSGDEGRSKLGVFCLRGKFINILTHEPDKVAVNKIFEALKKSLGLRQDMDYTSEANFKTLRYGSITFCLDADTDAFHIGGLLLLLFCIYWPSLYNRGFIKALDTPVVRVYLPKETLKFYNEHSFNEWFKEHPKTSEKLIKYTKGLSGNSRDDVKEDMTSAPTRVFVLDDKGKELIRRAFDKTLSNERKTWIQEWREIRNTIVPYVPKALVENRLVSEFMSESFPDYLIDNLMRSIPSYYDGLKKCQRQILWYALYLFNYGKTYDPTDKSGHKLIEFTSAVIGYSKYHHGDASLIGATIKMTQDYCGSNNLPMFKPIGLYGTRDGKAAKIGRDGKVGKPLGPGTDNGAPRYLGIAAPWWMQYVFDKTMISLVPRRIVDGKVSEPVWIPCDIPLGIINGSLGVATGHSSYIPSHHPIAVINWILQRLQGKKRIEPLVPYFKAYKGDIEIKTKNPKKGSAIVEVDLETSSVSTGEDECNEENVDDKIPEFLSGRGFVTTGKYEILKEYTSNQTMDIKITELPISTSVKAYDEFLDGLIDEGKIKGKRNNSNAEEETICFEIYNINANMVTHSALKLECGYPLSNLTTLDNLGIPVKFESVESMLAKYVSQMIIMYKSYQEHVIKMMEQDLVDIRMRMKIIKAYLGKKLIIIDRDDENIKTQLEKLDLDKKIFSELKLSKLSQTQVDALKKKLEEQEKELEIFKSKTPEVLWTERLIKFKNAFIEERIYPISLEDSVQIDDSSNMMIDGEISFKKALVNCIWE